MFINVRIRLSEILKFPGTVPYSLLVTSGFVVPMSELFREDVLKMDVALGSGSVARSPGRAHGRCHQDSSFFCL